MSFGCCVWIGIGINVNLLAHNRVHSEGLM
jgi:hypothetical protein